MSGRPRPSGLAGRILFLVGAVAMAVFLAGLAVLALLVMALVGTLIGAERLLALLVPAYRHRRRRRHVAMPAGLVRMVRFGSGPTQVIDARSYEPKEH